MMLLENKTAIVYGAAGAIGSAVARVFASEGAAVHLVGRTRESLDDVASTIDRTGNRVEVGALDATHRAAVEEHADAVARRSGGIDIAFNATSNDDLQGFPLVEMADEDVLRPVTKAVTTHLILATAVARHMVPRGTGVILAMGGGREAIAHLGGSHIAWSALAGLCRQLASDLGPQGIRVAWLLSPGSPDPSGPPGPPAQSARSTSATTNTERRGDEQTERSATKEPPAQSARSTSATTNTERRGDEQTERSATKEPPAQSARSTSATTNTSGDDPEATVTLLHRRPSLEDVANAAAFVASDRAATMTATEVNITGGAVVD